jgi:NAD+ diphosphatase
VQFMKNAESVTFGGSGLDRAAEMRGDSDALAARDTARACVFWRGKILLDANDRVMRLPMTHAILQDRSDDLIFLGRENEQLLFAADISRWLPEGFDPDAPISFLDDTRHVHRACIDGGFADIRMSMTLLSARDAEVAATGKAVMEWHRSHGFCAKCGQKSEIKMGGWQRDCPACGTHHFPRTDPVVIMLITHGNAVLMGRSPGWPEGMYSLLAGFIEPGETIEAAVRREVFEEAGVRVGEVSYLASQPWPFPASLMFGCAGEAVSHEIKIDPVEIEDALWVTREEMADIFAGQHPKIKPARKGAIAHFLLENWLADLLD